MNFFRFQKPKIVCLRKNKQTYPIGSQPACWRSIKSVWSSVKSKMLVRREILHSTPSCWYFFVEYPIEKYRKFHSKSFLKRPREKCVHSRNLECDHLLQFNTAPLDSGAVNNESARDTLNARHLALINGGLSFFTP